MINLFNLRDWQVRHTTKGVGWVVKYTGCFDTVRPLVTHVRRVKAAKSELLCFVQSLNLWSIRRGLRAKRI